MVPSCHLYRVALLPVSRFELAPAQLLPYCSPLHLTVTSTLYFEIASCFLHLPRCAAFLTLEITNNGGLEFSELSHYERRSNNTLTRDPFSSRGRKPKLAPWLLNFSFFFFYFTIFGLFANNTVCIEQNIKGVSEKFVENIAL